MIFLPGPEHFLQEVVLPEVIHARQCCLELPALLFGLAVVAELAGDLETFLILEIDPIFVTLLGYNTNDIVVNGVEVGNLNFPGGVGLEKSTTYYYKFINNFPYL